MLNIAKYFLTLPQVPGAKCFGCHSASGMLQPAMCRLAPLASQQSQGANHEYPAPHTPVFCWSIIKLLSIFISSLKFSMKFCTAGASNAKSLPPKAATWDLAKQNMKDLRVIIKKKHLAPTNRHISSGGVSSIKCCSVAHDFADDCFLGASSLVAIRPCCLAVWREHHLPQTCAIVANQIESILLISIQSWASWWWKFHQIHRVW